MKFEKDRYKLRNYEYWLLLLAWTRIVNYFHDLLIQATIWSANFLQ